MRALKQGRGTDRQYRVRDLEAGAREEGTEGDRGRARRVEVRGS